MLTCKTSKLAILSCPDEAKREQSQLTHNLNNVRDIQKRIAAVDAGFELTLLRFQGQMQVS